MENDKDKKKLDWKPAIRLFGQVSTWVVVPIVLSLIFGKLLDGYYGTEPWIFLGLTGIAFLISIFGIVKVISGYMKEISPDISKEKSPDSSRGSST